MTCLGFCDVEFKLQICYEVYHILLMDPTFKNIINSILSSNPKFLSKIYTYMTLGSLLPPSGCTVQVLQ